MPIRQQRTRNLRSFDPGQGPLPVLIPAPSVLITSPNVLQFMFLVPVLVSGIPPFICSGSGPPVSVTIISDTTFQLAYGFPILANETVTFEDWSSTLRGANGEWVAGFVRGVAGNAPALPVVRKVVSVATDGLGGVNWSLDGAWNPDNPPPLRVAGFTIAIASTADNIDWNVTYDLPVFGANLASVQDWDPLAYSYTSEAWIAPFLYTFT